MKKSSILLVLISAILVLSTFNFASAATSGSSIASSISGFIDGASLALAPIFQLLLGDVSGTGTQGPSFYLFAKLLVFLLVGAIVLAIADFLPFLKESENKWAKWMVVLIFDVLAVRFLEAQMIAAIILPYSVVAIALTSALPFVAYFFALYKGTENRLFRRVGWLLFAAVFIILFAIRSNEANVQGLFIYMITAVAAVIMFIFDGTIASLFRQAVNEQIFSEKRDVLLYKLRSEMLDWDAELAKGAITPKEYAELSKDYKKKLAALNAVR